MKRKMLAMVLSLAMVFSLVPTAALRAAEISEEPVAEALSEDRAEAAVEDGAALAPVRNTMRRY